MPRHRICAAIAFCVSPLDWPFLRTPLVDKRGIRGIAPFIQEAATSRIACAKACGASCGRLRPTPPSNGSVFVLAGDFFSVSDAAVAFAGEPEHPVHLAVFSFRSLEAISPPWLLVTSHSLALAAFCDQ